MQISTTQARLPFTSKLVEGLLLGLQIKQLYFNLQEEMKTNPKHVEEELKKGIKNYTRKTGLGRPIGRSIDNFICKHEIEGNTYFASFKYGFIKQSGLEEYGSLNYSQNYPNN
ncbi:MAG: hypothetical protein HY094_06705 [Candidatus Melainabacteria bacterium]|nr:hypothetical protein [Candidatus Melainabacteria bacterium]